MKEIYESGKPVRAEQVERAELERREYLAGFALACYEQEEGGLGAEEIAEALGSDGWLVQVTARSRFAQGRLAGVRAALGL